MITGVIVHLENDLPIVVDLERLPEPTDRLVVCTNVRTVDGKRPPFVNDRHATYIFPIEVIRVMEAPVKGGHADSHADSLAPVQQGHAPAETADETPATELPPALEEVADEEPDQDLLARIRSI